MCLRPIGEVPVTYKFAASGEGPDSSADGVGGAPSQARVAQQRRLLLGVLDAREDLLTPLKEFLNGNQKKFYDEVKTFATRYGDEFSSLPAEQLQPITDLLASSMPYAGDLIPKAKSALAALEQQLQAQLHQARKAAEASLDQQENQLKSGADFQALTPEQKGQVLQGFIVAKTDLLNASKPSPKLGS